VEVDGGLDGAMTDDPGPSLRSQLSPAEQAELAAAKLDPDDDTSDAIGYLVAWALHVDKIDADRALDWSDHSVWNEYDLMGALYIRDMAEKAILRLSPGLQAKLRTLVAAPDDKYRGFTVADPGKQMAQIANVSATGEGWWWYRVPLDGPITVDLARYPT
jgi:hypothetical protein